MGTVQHINPPELPAHGYTNVVVVTGSAKTIYVGGQNAVNAKGEIVGEGDFAAQVEQILHNMEIALKAAGAGLEHVVKWTICVVQGQSVQTGFEVFQRVWANRGNPPVITVLFVAGLGRPGMLAEIDAIAVVPE